jgi:hypothetical protein
MDESHVAWGAASMLLKLHGDHAPVAVAERLGQLASAGDMEGVLMWQRIAGCMARLMASAAQQKQ